MGVTSRSFPRLGDGLEGRVITPEDPAYDRARTVFLGGVDPRPALIARVAGAQDTETMACT